MIRSLSLAGLLAAAAALPALAQDKVVHIYNWSDYIAEDTIRKFEAETGIKVVYDVYDSNETLEAKLLAGHSGYDVVVPTSNFLQRQIAAGVYQPLDKSKLPNLENMDPELMKAAAAYDPDNTYGVIYMWGTNGIGYNVAKVAERLGEDAPTDSWSLIFDPKYAEKLADCGITLLDSASEVFPSALTYLGLDPLSKKPEDLEKAAGVIEAIRPYIRYYHSSQYISDLANGEVCVSLGYSGDVFQAAARAEEAGKGVEIAYSVPEEGAQQWFDMMAIPVDAPNPEAALAWINFIMKPEITADITNYVWYANANTASLPLVDPEIRDDPAIFPGPDVLAKLYPAQVYDARTDRLITKLWTRAKTGQ
ncbi:polyamine ABC transporter substrate-binding protein [Amaricoccus solimangrovi]|uniref:Putrescine-binding periplasmic protein n=1 Tax=Amaricoccus solimangrovi TaxID=2589815 RepID=A0A501WY54_9RHOB|nr:polyamine ABC transporter substrate-binding protein [Amaricoccus solimangrovi]TPE53672.1 polyamine ABC transporter substrate-binding protein [Amaricoccus solimangrovi]